MHVIAIQHASDSLGIETVAVQVCAMDAVGDKQGINSDPHCTGNVGFRTIANRQHAPRVESPARSFKPGPRQIIDRPVRLAGHDAASAHLRVETRDRAGAIDQALAGVHNNVGIGADQIEIAIQRRLQHRAIILRLAIPVIVRPGATDEVRRLDTGEFDRQSFIEFVIAIRPDPQGAARHAHGELRVDGIAGGHDRIDAAPGHAQLVKMGGKSACTRR